MNLTWDMLTNEQAFQTEYEKRLQEKEANLMTCRDMSANWDPVDNIFVAPKESYLVYPREYSPADGLILQNETYLPHAMIQNVCLYCGCRLPENNSATCGQCGAPRIDLHESHIRRST